MHIAIDDTYGTAGGNTSLYVTDSRRTYVAIIIEDDFVDSLRSEIISYKNELEKNLNISINEFHFVDIYNRARAWKNVFNESNMNNMDIFNHFATLSISHKIKILIQTIDERTIKDHGLLIKEMNMPGYDLDSKEDISLLFLMLKIRIKYKKYPGKTTLFIDQGRGKPNQEFGCNFFSDLPMIYEGHFQKSDDEPLLQMADFFAYCINRVTHLSVKDNRSRYDNAFLAFSQFMSNLDYDESDFILVHSNTNFKTTHTDNIHKKDRVSKKIKKP